MVNDFLGSGAPCGSVVEEARLVFLPSVVRGNCTICLTVFCVVCFLGFYLICVFSRTVLFVSISQVIGCEDCL